MSLFMQFIRYGLVLAALGISAVSTLALFGFAVPQLDLLNHGQILLLPACLLALLLVVVLLRGLWRSMAVVFTAVAVLASANVLVPELLASWRERPAPHGTVVRMMTHNLFGLNDDMAQVSAAIAAEDPDILVFQEYFGQQATDLHPALISKYPFFARCKGGKRANLGLYARLPFTQVEDGACPANAFGTDRTGHILAQFQTADGKRFSVMTTHLDWPFPVERQREQLTALSGVVNEIEGPLILAGDFNSTPWSYALRDFERRSGLSRDTVNLPTFPSRWFFAGAWRDTLPLLPLDQVMVRNGIVVHELHAGKRTTSDHLPVVFSFSVE